MCNPKNYIKERNYKMILHSVQGIDDMDSWFEKAPPLGGEEHWKPGRSAYELAAYMTKSLDTAPAEIEQALRDAGVNTSQCFDWGGEIVTDFAGQGLGIGSGRHHHAALWNDDVFVGIVAKADEELDDTADKWLSSVSGNQSQFANRKKRLDGLCQMIYGKDYDGGKYGEIRYQLLTALGGVLLEAGRCSKSWEEKRKTAVLLIMTFLKKDSDGRPYTSGDKVKRNKEDILRFQNSLPGWDERILRADTAFGLTNHIATFVRHITINLG